MHAELQQALGASVASSRPLGGGDINSAWAVRLHDGREVFVKSNPEADARLFAAEARGLDWLRAAGALRLPEVLAVSERFLVLEMLVPGPRRHDFDAELGRGLAALHRAGAPGFGLDHDNFIGTLPQDNAPCAGWAEFYWLRRLEPLARRAVDAGAGFGRAFAKLATRLPELVGPDEPPARLHGDLWGGNLHTAPDGAPALIDPAVYGGHREIDLAMMRLFGGFSDRVFAAYAEAWPLAPGHRERVPLYQLYPLLVHVCLFGGGYIASVESALGRYT